MDVENLEEDMDLIRHIGKAMEDAVNPRIEDFVGVCVIFQSARTGRIMVAHAEAPGEAGEQMRAIAGSLNDGLRKLAEGNPVLVGKLDDIRDPDKGS